MLLSDVFDKRSIKPNLEGKTKEDVFTELVEALTAIYPELDRNMSLRAIQDRENKLNTSVAPGVAVPHGYYPGTAGVFGALGFSETGIDYGAFDNQPVHWVCLIILGEASREKHLRVLNRVTSLINSEGLGFLRKAGSREAIHDSLSHVR
jgi:mannitol/fructose-specific phosphotransferase system IIA component (Ntr-type)